MMHRFVVATLLVLLLISPADAEESARKVLEETDISSLQEFAKEETDRVRLDALIDAAFSGEFFNFNDVAGWLKEEAAEPFRNVLANAALMLPPMLMLVLLGCIVPGGHGGSGGTRFLLLLLVMGAFSDTVLLSLDRAENGLLTAKRFSDAVSPVMSALTAAAGMTNAAGLISPMSAMAGGLAENVFIKYGMPLCRFALCTAIAGNLSAAVNLNRITRMLKKAVNWGAGLSITLFTALIALQSNITASMDTVALRTAKYAVDSVSPVIGSGVSDAWDSYVSSVAVAKNALGFSGIMLLFAAGIQPMLECAASMLLLSLVSALLDVLGEKAAANAAEQMAGICQMALMLCSSALAVGTILLGSAMALGHGLFA